MDRNKFNALTYVVLKALANAKAAPSGGVPNGHLYAQLMGEVNIDQWNRFVELMVVSGVVAQSNYFLTILPKGESLLGSINQIYAEAAETAKLN